MTDERDPEELADELFDAHIAPIGDDTDRALEWSQAFYGAIAARATTMYEAIGADIADR